MGALFRQPEERKPVDLTDHPVSADVAGRASLPPSLILSAIQLIFSIAGLYAVLANLLNVSAETVDGHWALITASFGPAAVWNLAVRIGHRRRVQWVAAVLCVCCYLPVMMSLYQSNPVEMRGTQSSPWFVFAAMAGLWSVVSAVSNSVSLARNEPCQNRMQIREQQMVLIVAAVCSAGGAIEFPLLRFVPTVVGLYLIALGLEVSLRVMILVLTGSELSDPYHHPLLTRDLLFGRAQRLHPSSTLATASTISIRRPVIAALVTTAVVGWLTTGITVVSVHELALYYRNGHLDDEVLSPGLHLHLPAPFGRTKRIPAGRVEVTTVGYLLDARKLSKQKYLWTESHGEEEVSFIVGDGTEVVAINAIIRHCPGNSISGLQQYMTLADSPEEIVRRAAMGVLLAESRTLTVAELLTMNRSEWSQRLRERLSGDLDDRKLGIEIKGVDIVSVHPPVEIASAYLDIIDANVRAEAEVAEARGAHESELTRSRMMADTTIADASASASVRLTAVAQEVEQLKALAEVAGDSRSVFEQHAWCDSMSEALSDREIIFVSNSVSSGIRLLMGSDTPVGSPQK